MDDQHPAISIDANGNVIAIEAPAQIENKPRDADPHFELALDGDRVVAVGRPAPITDQHKRELAALIGWPR